MVWINSVTQFLGRLYYIYDCTLSSLIKQEINLFLSVKAISLSFYLSLSLCVTLFFSLKFSLHTNRSQPWFKHV